MLFAFFLDLKKNKNMHYINYLICQKTAFFVFLMMLKLHKKITFENSCSISQIVWQTLISFFYIFSFFTFQILRCMELLRHSFLLFRSSRTINEIHKNVIYNGFYIIILVKTIIWQTFVRKTFAYIKLDGASENLSQR